MKLTIFGIVKSHAIKLCQEISIFHESLEKQPVILKLKIEIYMD